MWWTLFNCLIFSIFAANIKNMDRLLIEDLKIWKDKSDRKPLILRGARQVGKTWLLKDFGEKCFKDICYVNFEQKDMLGKIFEGTLSPQRIIEQLSVFHGKRYNHKKRCLFLMKFRNYLVRWPHWNILQKRHPNMQFVVQVHCLVLPCMREHLFLWARLTS